MAKNTKQRKENGKTGKTPIDRDVLMKELAGISLMLLSLFLICAILSYHPEDETAFGTLVWHDIFSKAAGEAAKDIHNPFGLVGARLSAFFIRSFLGYPFIFTMLSVLYCGWSLLRSNSLKPALFFFLYSAFISIDASLMFGLTSEPFSDVMSGAIGRMLSSLLSRAIGLTGAWVFAGVLVLLLTFYMGRNVLIALSEGASTLNAGISSSLSGIGEWLDQMRKKKDESRRLKEENRLEKEERRLLEKGAHKK
ncbi:MAG: cell division protein FtsK, partial [Chlorobiaceae bacterium]|nr:cell division protein FtsK [Chlorobiaceae bacterium]